MSAPGSTPRIALVGIASPNDVRVWRFETLEPQPYAPEIVDVAMPPIGPTDIRHPRSARHRDDI